MAIRRIRRSRGMMEGLGLAIFDGMIFAVLIFTGLVALAWDWSLGVLNEALSALSSGRRLISLAYALFTRHHPGLVILGTLVVVVPVVWIVISRLWRKVRQPLP